MADPKDKVSPGATTLYSGVKSLTQSFGVPFNKAWLEASRIAEAKGWAPEGFTGAGKERLQELQDSESENEWSARGGALLGGAASMYIGGRAIGAVTGGGAAGGLSALSPASNYLGSAAKAATATASPLARGLATTAAAAAGGGAETAVYSAIQGGTEQASRDYLSSGEINGDHVAIAAGDSFKDGLVGGALFGGGLHLLGLGVKPAVGLVKRGGEKVMDMAGNAYWRRAGVNDITEVVGSQSKATQAALDTLDMVDLARKEGKPHAVADVINQRIDALDGNFRKYAESLDDAAGGRKSALIDKADQAKTVLTERGVAERAERIAKLRGEVVAPTDEALFATRKQGALEGEAAYQQYFETGLKPDEGVRVSATPGKDVPKPRKYLDTLEGALTAEEHGRKFELFAKNEELAAEMAKLEGTLNRYKPTGSDTAAHVSRRGTMASDQVGPHEGKPVKVVVRDVTQEEAEAAYARKQIIRQEILDNEAELTRLHDKREAAVGGKTKEEFEGADYFKDFINPAKDKAFKAALKPQVDVAKELDKVFRETFEKQVSAEARMDKSVLGAAARLENIRTVVREAVESGDLTKAIAAAKDASRKGMLGAEAREALGGLMRIQAERKQLAAIAEAIRSKDPSAVAQRNLWAYGKRLAGVAARGAVGGIGAYSAGLGPGLALTGLGLAQMRFAPNAYTRTARALYGLTEAVAAKHALESGARDAVGQLALRGAVMGTTVGRPLAYSGTNDIDRDRKVTEDIASVIQQKTESDVHRLQAKLDAIGLPETLKDSYLQKMVLVNTNLQRRLPKPVVNLGRPRYSDSERMGYEEYMEVALDPLVAIKHLKRGTLTNKHALAVRENYPEVVQAVMNAILDSDLQTMDETSIRRLEMFTGQTLVADHTKDNVQFRQRAFDQMNRTNTEGSQGGGSAPSGGGGSRAKNIAVK